MGPEGEGEVEEERGENMEVEGEEAIIIEVVGKVFLADAAGKAGEVSAAGTDRMLNHVFCVGVTPMKSLWIAETSANRIAAKQLLADRTFATPPAQGVSFLFVVFLVDMFSGVNQKTMTTFSC